MKKKHHIQVEKKNLEKNTYPPANTVLLKQTEILSLADNENKIYNHTSIRLRNPLSSRESNIF